MVDSLYPADVLGYPLPNGSSPDETSRCFHYDLKRLTNAMLEAERLECERALAYAVAHELEYSQMLVRGQPVLRWLEERFEQIRRELASRRG